MSELHEWNVILVEKYDFPRKAQKEFQVDAKSVRGAVMKAQNKINKDVSGWKIKSIWRLDPKRVKREIS